jgi:hypothetical protein
LPGQGQPADDAVVADAAAIVETLADPVTDSPSSNPSPPPTCEHPTPPHAAIRMFLEALGVPPQQVPASLEGQTALYHSRLNGKRMLILLDNAGDADQVRPLLPGSPTCPVLVTSRNACPLIVDLLTADEARQLLAARLGKARVAAEPDATAEIITSCARLPLALSIMAARAAAHPMFPLATLAEELRDAHSRLDALTVEDPATDVRAMCSISASQDGFSLSGIVTGKVTFTG